MAKLAHQMVVIQLSKAVSNSASDDLVVLDDEALAQILEAIEALAGDNGAVIEMTNGE